METTSLFRIQLMALCALASPGQAFSDGRCSGRGFLNSLAIEDSTLPPEAIRAIERVAREAFPEICRFPGLRQISGSTGTPSLSQRLGHYFPEKEEVVLEVIDSITEEDYLKTLIHEMGHALILSHSNDVPLGKLASHFGPWAPIPTQIRDLNQPVFFQSHPDIEATPYRMRGQKFVPSQYGLTNRHEWFAESFLAWTMSIINKTSSSIPKGLAQELEQLTHASKTVSPTHHP